MGRWPTGGWIEAELTGVERSATDDGGGQGRHRRRGDMGRGWVTRAAWGWDVEVARAARQHGFEGAGAARGGGGGLVGHAHRNRERGGKEKRKGETTV
jgi:hypothetical protein